MNKKLLIGILTLTISLVSYGKEKNSDSPWGDAQKSKAEFTDAEANFKLVMQKILEKYIDKSVSKNDLYRAATAGMLDSLNSSDQSWNKLLSPEEFSDMRLDITGKISGIGAEMKFDENTGHAQIIRLVSGSPAEKAGIKIDDQILSVEGKKFKGKSLLDLVLAIRGTVGTSVGLKVLREDKILNMDVKRETIAWTRVDLQSVNPTTSLLTIGYFTEDTPKLVEEMINKVNNEKVQKLIIDLRGNSGGGFDQAVQTADLFLPKDSLIVSTKNRDGKMQEYRSQKGLLGSNVQIVILTNKETKSGAELFTAALKENRKVETVGENTFGKWNAQTVETLPNNYAFKFTVNEFLSPAGKSYQGTGIKPDLEVGLAKDTDYKVLHSKYSLQKRVELDSQLKAAIEILKPTTL